MRTNKQILRGDFPEDHNKKVTFYKCLFNSSAIAKNPILFHKKWFDMHNDSFSVVSPFRGRVMLTRNATLSKQILQKQHKIYHKSKIQTKFLLNTQSLLIFKNGSKIY